MHPDLCHLRDQLRAILRDMVDFGPTISTPPVLDSSFEAIEQEKTGVEEAVNRESVPGLRSLRDAVQRDLDVLEKVGDPSGRASGTAGNLTLRKYLQ